MLAWAVLQIEIVSVLGAHELPEVWLPSELVRYGYPVQVFFTLYFPVCALGRESGIYPVRRLIDISVVALLRVRKTDDNHRRQSPQAFGKKPAQNIAGLFVDYQPVELVNVRHLLLSANAIAQRCGCRNAKRAHAYKLKPVV